MKKITAIVLFILTLLLILGTSVGKAIPIYWLDLINDRLPPKSDSIVNVAFSGERWESDTTNLALYDPSLDSLFNRMRNHKGGGSFTGEYRVEQFYLSVIRSHLFVIPPRLYIIRDSYPYPVHYYYCRTIFYLEEFTGVKQGHHEYESIQFATPRKPFRNRLPGTVSLTVIGDTLRISYDTQYAIGVTEQFVLAN